MSEDLTQQIADQLTNGCTECGGLLSDFGIPYHTHACSRAVDNPVPCFACGKRLKHIDTLGISRMVENRDLIHNQPNDGVGFATGGNYGSAVIDSIDGSDTLEIAVCDDCLRAHKDRTRRLRRHIEVSVNENW